MNDAEYMDRVTGMERKLYRIAHAILWNDHDCCDAVQEAVLKGWLKRGSLREEGYFDTWLVRILINECRNIQRSHRLRLLPLDEGIRSTVDDGNLLESLQLREALRNLPEKYRMALLLHHMEGYSLEETAEILRITRGLAASRLSQARKALRKLLETGDEEHDRI